MKYISLILFASIWGISQDSFKGRHGIRMQPFFAQLWSEFVSDAARHDVSIPPIAGTITMVPDNKMHWSVLCTITGLEIEDCEKAGFDLKYSKAVGTCWRDEWSPFKFDLQISDLTLYSYEYARTVFYHELGHCLFDLGHTDGDMNSIMYYASTDYYGDAWPFYVDEFFSSIKNPKAVK